MKYDNIETKARKYHYWRGFAVASAVWGLGFVIFCHALIKLAQ